MMSSFPDIDSLVHFTENAPAMAEKIKTSGAPLSRAERRETVEALKEALLDVEEGRTRPATEAFADFQRRHGISG